MGDVARRVWWVGFWIYAACVFVIGVIPIPPVGPKIPSFDKIEHLAEYVVFSWILARALMLSGYSWRRAASIAVIGAMAFGGCIELIQAFLPYRQAEWLDELANTVGGVVGVQLVSARLREKTSHG